MRRLRDTRLGLRIGGGFGLVLLLLLAVMVTALGGLRQVGRENDTLMHKVWPRVRLANTVKGLIGANTRLAVRRLITSDAAMLGEMSTEFDANRGRSNAVFDTLKSLVEDRDELQTLELIASTRTAYRESDGRVNDLRVSGRSLDANRLYNVETSRLAASYIGALDSLIQIQERKLQEAAGKTDAAVHMTQWIVLLLTVGAVVLGIVTALAVTRGVTGPVGAVARLAGEMARGNLRSRATVDSEDEVGRMAGALNQAVGAMQESVGLIARTSQAIASSSEEFSAVSTEIGTAAEETKAQAGTVASAAEQVSRNVETVAAGAEEMAVSIREIARNASEAAMVAASAVSTADEAGQTIGRLETSSEEIGAVVKVITSIAYQTNLLALNATIEAARAGEAGKGFAVVATEVKELAKATAEASEGIARKIQVIQADSEGAVKAVRAIREIIGKINDISGTIASAVEEQSATTDEIGRNVAEAALGSREIARNISSVAGAAQSTAVGAESSLQAAAELARMASELQQLVGRFTHDDSDAGRYSGPATPVRSAGAPSTTRGGSMKANATAGAMVFLLLLAGRSPALEAQAILARVAVRDTGGVVADSARTSSERASMARFLSTRNTARPVGAVRLPSAPVVRPERAPVSVMQPVRPKQDLVDSLTAVADSLNRTLSELRTRLATSVSEMGEVRGVIDSLIQVTGGLNQRVSALDSRTAASAGGASSLRVAIDSLSGRTDSLARSVAAVDTRAAGLGNFRFSGDFRVRLEGTSQDGIVSRYRERSRARLNILGNPSGQFTAGLSISTGNTNEPQTENQTATGFFTRKSLSFDRFFLTYRPAWMSGLSLTAGRFSVPWQKTGLTFSPDLQVEGVSVGFLRPVRASVLQEVGVVGYYLPMLEVAADLDTYMRGGQVQSRWGLSRRLSARVVAGVNEVKNPDPIAVAQSSGSIVTAFPASNTVVRDSAGKVTGYAVGFRYAEAIVGLDYALSPRWPLSLQLDLVSNRAAATQRNAWLAEARLGALVKPGDLQWTYAYYRIERDAVVGAFNEGDIRSATNSRAHRMQAAARLQRNVTAGVSLWLGQLADPSLTPTLLPADRQGACKTEGQCEDPMWKRLQVDVSYTF